MVPLLDVENKISSNQVFIMWRHLVSRFQNGITLRYWKNFLKIFFKKLEKIFWIIFLTPSIYKKHLQYPSVIPFWNCETKCHHMALIKTWFEDFIFSTSKGGGTLWISWIFWILDLEDCRFLISWILVQGSIRYGEMSLSWKFEHDWTSGTQGLS